MTLYIKIHSLGPTRVYGCVCVRVFVCKKDCVCPTLIAGLCSHIHRATYTHNLKFRNLLVWRKTNSNCSRQQKIWKKEAFRLTESSIKLLYIDSCLSVNSLLQMQYCQQFYVLKFINLNNELIKIFNESAEIAVQ